MASSADTIRKTESSEKLNLEVISKIGSSPAQSFLDEKYFWDGRLPLDEQWKSAPHVLLGLIPRVQRVRSVEEDPVARSDHLHGQICVLASQYGTAFCLFIHRMTTGPQARLLSNIGGFAVSMIRRGLTGSDLFSTATSSSCESNLMLLINCYLFGTTFIHAGTLIQGMGAQGSRRAHNVSVSRAVVEDAVI